MARLNKYPLDSNITKTDILLGSDGGGSTKNYAIPEIGKAISKFNMAGQPQIGYYYQQDLSTGRQPGTISINGGATQVAFTSLSSIIVSKYSFDSQNTSENLLLSFVGTEITITDIDNPNNFGTYTLDSATALDSNFYTLSLFNKNGNGDIIKDQLYVLSSRKGDVSFVYEQNTGNPQQVWNITHNLNKKPSVTIVTATDTTVVGEVTYNNNNQLTITLSSANSGKAYLN